MIYMVMMSGCWGILLNQIEFKGTYFREQSAGSHELKGAMEQWSNGATEKEKHHVLHINHIHHSSRLEEDFIQPCQGWNPSITSSVGCTHGH